MKPTTDQTLCKDGSPAVTYDGVAITADGEYWAIPVLNVGHFQELPLCPSEIPDEASKVLGQEIIDSGYPFHFASTREKANVAGVYEYLRLTQRRIEIAKQEQQLFERYYGLAFSRLAAHQIKNSEYRDTKP